MVSRKGAEAQRTVAGRAWDQRAEGSRAVRRWAAGEKRLLG